jgi:16S rRNA (uracil1498-N3)-methyltransferase
MNDEPSNLAEPGGNVRLFVPDPLTPGAEIVLSDNQSHYLAHVMRARTGDFVRLFNGRDGEWRASVSIVTKHRVSLRAHTLTLPQTPAQDVWLLFAPIKKTPLDYVAQKAAELGVSVLQPVLTRRTIVARVNTGRLLANAIEASEQSGRLDVPEVREPVALARLIETWDPARTIYFCDEGGSAQPMAQTARSNAGGSRAAILTGPEGGFDPGERQLLRTLSYIVPVSLGPRILRADTAALAALAIWQSTSGDWK